MSSINLLPTLTVVIASSSTPSPTKARVPDLPRNKRQCYTSLSLELTFGGSRPVFVDTFLLYPLCYASRFIVLSNSCLII